MKLEDHVEHIRQLIETSFKNQLGRMGITFDETKDATIIPNDYREDRYRIENIFDVLIEETKTRKNAYEKLVDELTFTLFNRLSALKVMEAHRLQPEVITRRTQHGDRSFAHFLWLEQNTNERNEELEGLLNFITYQFKLLASDIPLFSLYHPYHLLPTVIELNEIINAFNQIDIDSQVDDAIWTSDDVLGWLYESYNNYKKTAHKESGDKTEYNKVSVQSQIYTPRWVVKFLVDNSLGKLYLEMFPDSKIKDKYKIANAPKTRIREIKSLTDIKIIDPSTGSGNFLLYAFDLFYDFYLDQIENYGADYDERKIPELIIHNNLHGIDLDDRAVQLAQLGLYIKAKRKRSSVKIEQFNIVSSDFFLPDFEYVRYLFETEEKLSPELENIVVDIWSDLQQAHKFGSLIRIEEKFSSELQKLEQRFNKKQIDLFEDYDRSTYQNFRNSFFTILKNALDKNTDKQGISFINTKTHDAIIFLQMITQKYDTITTNPPYLESDQYGLELREFIKKNYENEKKYGADLYSVFIKRCLELNSNEGILALIQPNTFMHLVSFKDLRELILDTTQISILVNCEFKLFESVLVTPSLNIFTKKIDNLPSIFVGIDKNLLLNVELLSILDNISSTDNYNYIYYLNQNIFKKIKNYPFSYWIQSERVLELFQTTSKIVKFLSFCNGIQTGGNNERFFRTFWEIDNDDISTNYFEDKKKWVTLNKGGDYEKWYGNLWLVCEWNDYGNSLKELRKTNKKVRITSEEFYFNEGLAFTGASSKGLSVRYQPKNCIFEIAGKSIFRKSNEIDLFYYLGFLNSKLASYFLYCLNPTVNFQTGDLEKIPFIKPNKRIELIVASLSKLNVELKKNIKKHSIIEIDFEQNPLELYKGMQSIIEYLNSYIIDIYFVNTLIMINEGIIDELILILYNISEKDRDYIFAREGRVLSVLKINKNAKKLFISKLEDNNILRNSSMFSIIRDYIVNLPTQEEEHDIDLSKLTINLDDFCISNYINPINILWNIENSNFINLQEIKNIISEFLMIIIKEILKDNIDGILMSQKISGSETLIQQIENKIINLGYDNLFINQLYSLFPNLDKYLYEDFFRKLIETTKVFPRIISTPFIWHLSSGEHKGFEAFILIYKWNRDSLYKLKTNYISKRVESLKFRLIQLTDSNTAEAQSEKEIIRLQLKEIEEFTKKIDELIAEGYDPKLDDGVGKNIAPLQNKGMLKCDVLNKKQLEKYLKADW